MVERRNNLNSMKAVNNKIKIAFSWNELPVYGARLLRAGIRELGLPVEIVATRPTIPILGMDEIVNQKIYWIDKTKVKSWDELGLEVPDIFFQAGWYIDSFINLGNEVKNKGGKVVLLSDNCWKNSIRQWIGALVYRIKYRKYFDAVWVPGKSGQTLMRFFGVKKENIFKGLYGSDPISFEIGPPLSQRKKYVLFVGQLIDRKGIPQLATVFSKFHNQFPDWQLIIFGDGPLRDLIHDKPGIIVFPFAQPLQIAKSMREARFLVLPALEDHWPMVVNEASLSGCGLILSDRVGNISEFVGKENGYVYPVNSQNELLDAFVKITKLNDNVLDKISDESRNLGMKFTPHVWAEVFKKILTEIN